MLYSQVGLQSTLFSARLRHVDHNYLLFESGRTHVAWPAMVQHFHHRFLKFDVHRSRHEMAKACPSVLSHISVTFICRFRRFVLSSPKPVGERFPSFHIPSSMSAFHVWRFLPNQHGHVLTLSSASCFTTCTFILALHLMG